MTNEKMNEKLDQIFKEVREVRQCGAREYSHSGLGAFDNFQRTAAVLDLSPVKALLVLLLKHIDGICAYAKGHISQREDVRGRIKDAICYLCLLRGMIDESALSESTAFDSKWEEELSDTSDDYAAKLD